MAKQGFFEGFKSFDYNNPDFENMGSWPAGIKLVTCILLVGIIGFAGYWFIVKDQYQSLAREEGKEVSLKDQFSKNAFKVSNLEAFKTQLAEMRETFGALLEQLPNETEISGLLDDITFTGVQSGLEFDSLELSGDVPKEFYIETPIAIAVRGEYHEMGTFISGISALPRIVTLHDFTITSSKDRKAQENDGSRTSPLVMKIEAKTYRYNPGEDQ
ncbi:type 4a pilus biogenesis protein PilO [Gynuella sp.]|uniref:type 4a pilus biogenesis protein PilO n=1 Tax=Gynuella sp. TaxID=2969146 RepID=UPI003D10E880